ncbi:MAG TPA: TIR domain-containing protein, partial [Aggregatilineales bacterium]|nr:TIR domain-containing protein [Aggregatilineales bacterium]
VDFPIAERGHWQTAHVVIWVPQQLDGSGDIAGLELDSDPPAEAQVLPFAQAANLWKHPFRIFGFPAEKPYGTVSTGQLLNQTAANWQGAGTADATSGARGFSGSPVWDEQLEAIVGMVIATDQPPSANGAFVIGMLAPPRRGAVPKPAFILPTETLLAAWPDLGAGSSGRTRPVTVAAPAPPAPAPVSPPAPVDSPTPVEPARPADAAAQVEAVAPVEAPLQSAGSYLFISYSRANKDLVSRLIADLTAYGQQVWIDKRGLKAGTPNWEQALRSALQSSRAVLLVASPESRRSAYVQDELSIAQMYKRPIYPVWVTGEDYIDCVPMGMGKTQYVDLRGASYSDGLRELVEALGEPGSALVVQESEPPVSADRRLPSRDPFKGLTAFTSEDAGDFFGRDSLVATLLEHVNRLVPEGQQTGAQRAERFLAVIGPSGSGKSSVVMAGLLPRLATGALPGSDRWVYLPPLLPGADPIDALSLTLEAALPAKSYVAVQEDLNAPSAQGLHLLARRIAYQATAQTKTHVVLLIDQFEELFTQTTDEKKRQQFIDLLTTAATEPDGPLVVVLTLRADFYDRPMNYLELGRLIKDNSESVLPMSLSDLRDAIEKPAALPDVHLTFDDGLVAELVFEVREQIGALPLLQFTLDQLFKLREGNRLTLAAYHLIGGVRGALTKRAEETYNGLPSENHRRLTRALFLRLIEPGSTEQDTTRRRAAFSELTLADPEQNQIIGECAETFVNARLLTASQIGDTTTLEVSHEALIREWRRLNEWLSEARADIRLQHKISDDTSEWMWAGKPLESGMLYRGDVLTSAEGWMARNIPSADESEFIAASVAEREKEAQAERERQAYELQLQRRSANRARYLAGLFAVFFVVAAGLSIFALINWNNTQISNTRSESLRSAADAILQTSLDKVELVALLSVRALRSSYSSQADTGLSRAMESLTSVQIYQGHVRRVRGVAFTPDGQGVLTASYDGTARLWDRVSGKQLQIFGTPPPPTKEGEDPQRLVIYAVAVSPDGKMILTGDETGAATLWDRASGQLIRKLVLDPSVKYGGDVMAVAFSPDGRFALTGSAGDGAVTLFDVGTGQLVQKYEGHTDYVTGVAFSPDGNTIVSSSGDRTIRIWETQTGKQLERFDNSDIVFAVAFSPDGRYIASGNGDNQAHLFLISTGTEVRQFAGHTDSVRSVAFSPDSRYLVTGSDDNTARLWDVQSGQQLSLFIGHSGSPIMDEHGNPYPGTVDAVAFSPNGRYVLTGGADATARLWAILDRLYLSHEGAVDSIAYSPDGRYFVSGGEDKTVRLWDASTGKEIREFDGNWYRVDAVAFSPDGRYVMSAGVDGAIRLWNTETGAPQTMFAASFPIPDTSSSGGASAPATPTPGGVVTWDPHNSGAIDSAVFSPDGQYILANGALWNAATGQQVQSFDAIDPETHQPYGTQAFDLVAGSGVAVSPDGKYVLMGSLGNTARLWGRASGRELRWYVSTGPVWAVAFSPDSKYVVTGAADVSVRLFDTVSAKQIRQFNGHTGPIRSVAFSPDGRFVLSASDDGTARLWNTETGDEVRRFTGHKGAVTTAIFSPDGRYVLTAGADGTIRLWDTNYLDYVAYACHHLFRDFTDTERQIYQIADHEPTCPQFGKQTVASAPTWTPIPTSTIPAWTPAPTATPTVVPQGLLRLIPVDNWKVAISPDDHFMLTLT